MDIHSYTCRLVASLSTAMNKFNRLLVFEQALSTLQTAVSSLLHTNSVMVQNIVDASRGKVTSTLFPVKDFLHVLALDAFQNINLHRSLIIRPFTNIIPCWNLFSHPTLLSYMSHLYQEMFLRSIKWSLSLFRLMAPL